VAHGTKEQIEEPNASVRNKLCPIGGYVFFGAGGVRA
jgi:hypothetical protein